jgi:4-amino-4-deoxy-L-arabinose transferase-like glycosyltransferase
MAVQTSRSLPSLRVLLALAALLLVCTLAWRPLALPDEGRYISVAAQMWASGDWIVPRLDGLPFLHKPPLFYWIAAALYGLSGTTAWMARGASWLGAVLGALSIAWLAHRAGRERGDGELAGWSVVALIAQPLWYMGAQYANLDMLVAGCIALAICALAIHELDPRHPSARWIGFVALALGVLAKGLIGVVLPLAVLGVWMAWERRFSAWRHLAWLPGWSLLLVIVTPWFFAVEARHPGFLHYFFVVQHFQRYTATGFNNAQPGWFFPALLALLALPWSVGCAASLVEMSRQRRALLAPSPDAAVSLARLGAVWLVLVTLFFSLPASKLAGYILPAVPALALVAAGTLDRLARSSLRWRRALQSAALVSLALCMAAPAAVTYLDEKSSATLADQLRGRWRPGDALVYDHAFIYDLALLAGYHGDVPIVHDWNDPVTVRGDGWERILADAASFDAARGHAVLRLPDDWARLRCAAPRTWLVAISGASSAVIMQIGRAPLITTRNLDVYLVTRPTNCSQ